VTAEPRAADESATQTYVPMVARPVTRDEAMAYVRAHHRHSKKGLPGWKFGSGLFDPAGQLVGVGIAGNCAAREWHKQGGGHFIEIRRVATEGARNACSQLYGGLTRAAKAIGYCTAWTYTLAHESGSSLRASGREVFAHRTPRGGWDSASRPRDETDWPSDAKVLWIKRLNPCAEHERTHPVVKATAADPGCYPRPASGEVDHG
jgi:hypothetical protein